MHRVLFVDDERYVLETLGRLLTPIADGWHIRLAASGQEALQALEEQPFDAVVSDMLMPGMDGLQLLEKVRQTHPEVVRIVFSAYSDEAVTLKSAGTAHQYLLKPCTPERLHSTVSRACALRNLLQSEEIRRVISQIDSLPSVPMVYLQLLDELKSPEPSIQRAAEIIERDVGMTAKILQLANSAFFAFRHKVSSPRQAVTLIGLRTTKDLVLTVEAFAEFDHRKLRQFPMQAVVNHCLETAALARAIAVFEGAPRDVVDDAFMAGLLHDVGKLLLADRLPLAYVGALRAARERGIPLWQAEREAIGTSHAEVGAYLMGLWGLPDPIVEALAYHHRPEDCPHHEFTVLTAVHAAGALEEDAARRWVPWVRSTLSQPYLERLGLADRPRAWSDCRDPRQRDDFW